MEDRELIELAAKAAGMPGGFGKVLMILGSEVDLTGVWYVDADQSQVWQPLVDDGEAMRLAHALDLTVSFGEDFTGVYWKGPVLIGLSDLCPRRAIVRAAAEIGKAMQEKH